MAKTGKKTEKEGVKILKIGELRVHEKTDMANLAKIENELAYSKKVVPFLVDQNSLVVLDGHHRLATMKRMGKKPCPRL
jgi:ParB-like chromosome segregation protein Spo0J